MSLTNLFIPEEASGEPCILKFSGQTERAIPSARNPPRRIPEHLSVPGGYIGVAKKTFRFSKFFSTIPQTT
jgi:hypothetical protein